MATEQKRGAPTGRKKAAEAPEGKAQAVGAQDDSAAKAAPVRRKKAAEAPEEKAQAAPAQDDAKAAAARRKKAAEATEEKAQAAPAQAAPAQQDRAEKALGPVDEARIRERAYLIWIEEGQPHGRDLEFWQRARDEFKAD